MWQNNKETSKTTKQIFKARQQKKDLMNAHKVFFDYKTIKHYDYPKLEISYSTVHGSKGLESDFVVLIESALREYLNNVCNKKSVISIYCLRGVRRWRGGCLFNFFGDCIFR